MRSDSGSGSGSEHNDKALGGMKYDYLRRSMQNNGGAAAEVMRWEIGPAVGRGLSEGGQEPWVGGGRAEGGKCDCCGMQAQASEPVGAVKNLAWLIDPAFSDPISPASQGQFLGFSLGSWTSSWVNLVSQQSPMCFRDQTAKQVEGSASGREEVRSLFYYRAPPDQ